MKCVFLDGYGNSIMWQKRREVKGNNSSKSNSSSNSKSRSCNIRVL